jgi:hypothetical protein
MKSICVYCGSSQGNKPHYQEKAKKLGTILARKDLTLVYGGGKHGLMGMVADAVLGMGGRAVGVIPENLKNKDLAHPGLNELHVVKGMHERKAKMVSLSDAFIALPGGFGTLDEILEVITWNQLGIQSKPIGFLNVDGYYDILFKFMEKGEKEGFINPGLVKALVLESDPEELVERLMKQTWPILGVWPIKSKG